MSRQPILKPLDEALFKQIDKIYSSAFYSKIKELLSNLDDDKRSLVIHVISFTLISIPFFVVLIVFFSNQSLKTELALKEKIYHLGEDIIADRKQLEAIAFNFINNSSIDNDSALQSRIKSMLSGTRVDTNKITISEFNSNPSFNNSNQVIADVNFNRFSASDLTELLSAMINREKFKVSNMNIKKNAETAQLEGKTQIIFNTQAQVAMEYTE